jgi:hypothetical protein
MRQRAEGAERLQPGGWSEAQPQGSLMIDPALKEWQSAPNSTLELFLE